MVLRLICETIRNLAVVVYNSAYGRAEKDVIRNPSKLWSFGWEQKEKVEIQTVDEMKNIMLAFAWQHGKKKDKKQGT